MSEAEEVFIDVSVLMDYCRPYAAEHQHTKRLLDEIAVPMVTSDFIKGKFSTLMKQRHDLYTKFFQEVPRYFEDLREPSDAEMEVAHGRIFDINYLDQVISTDIHKSTERDIQQLGQEFETSTPHEFLRTVDDIQQRAEAKESAINKISKTVPCQFHHSLDPYLYPVVGDEMRATSVAHAVDYFQDKSSNTFFVRHGGPIFRNRDKINDLINTWMDHRATLEIVSPKQATDQAPVN